MSKILHCVHCNQDFETDRPDNDAIAEAKALFGSEYDEKDHVVLCDPCWRKIMGFPPIQYTKNEDEHKPDNEISMSALEFHTQIAQSFIAGVDSVYETIREVFEIAPEQHKPGMTAILQMLVDGRPGIVQYTAKKVVEHANS